MHDLGRNELVGTLAREFTLNADLEEVGVLSVLFSPLANLPFIGNRHRAAVNRARVPILFTLVEALEKAPAITSRVAEQKHHRLAVSQAAFCHVVDSLGNCRRLVEYIKRRGACRVLTGKRFGVFFAASDGVNAPRFGRFLGFDRGCLDLKHVLDDGTIEPFFDFSPCLCLELAGCVGRHDALSMRTR